jgi:hypothetical protein
VQNLDLSDDEAAVLKQELHDIVENDRYPLSPRIHTLRACSPNPRRDGARAVIAGEGVCREKRRNGR